MKSMKPAKETIHADGLDIAIYTENFQDEFISITDIARYKSNEPNDVIRNWMRNRDTLEFLGLWESLNNPGFKPIEFDGFKKEAGLNAFTMSPSKWISNVNAIRSQVDMAVLLLIQTLLSNLHPGYLQNSSFILLRITKD